MTVPTVAGTVTGSSTASNTVATSSHTPSANDLLIAFIALRDRPSGVSVSSISGNGLTWVQVAAREGTQGEERIECWRAQGASPSAGAVTATLSATCNAAVITVHRISGANQGGTNGSAAVEVNAAADTGATDTSSPSVDITTLSADSLVMAGCSHRTRTFSVGTGETSVSLNNSAGTAGDTTALSVERHDVTSPSTVTMDGSLNGVIDWSIIAIAIKPGGSQFLKSVAGTLSSSGALSKQARKSLAGTLTSSGALARRVLKVLAGTLTSAGTLSKRISKPLAGTLTISGSLGAARIFLKSVAGTLSSSGALSKQTRKSLAGTLSSAGTLSRRVSKSIGGTLTSSGSLSAIRLIVKNIGGTLSSSGALSRQTRKSLAGTLASAGALSKRISKPLAGTLSSSGVLTAGRLLFKTIGGTLTSSGSLSAFKFRLLALRHHIARVLAQLRAFTPTDRRLFLVPAQNRYFEVNAMALAEVVKAPAAVLDYQIDWSTYLDSDTIVTSTWTVPAGVTSEAESNTTTTATIRLSGGTAGTKYTITNHVVLNSGQEDERSIVVVVQAL